MMQQRCFAAPVKAEEVLHFENNRRLNNLVLQDANDKSKERNAYKRKLLENNFKDLERIQEEI